MFRETEKTGGWILLETIVSLAILGMLIAGMTVAQEAAARMNACHLARQRCLAAAQAQLDSLAATGDGLAQEDLQRLWPGVSVNVQTQPGKGDWSGLTRVEVAASTAIGKGRPAQIRVALSRYLPDSAATKREE
jgi:type II secretory pathway pseudopilin PulG